MRRMVLLNKKDNVAVALDDIAKDEILREEAIEVCALEDIPYGHKIALADMEKGETVFKYGEPVARVTEKIRRGQWVHVHNVESIRGLGR